MFRMTICNAASRAALKLMIAGVGLLAGMTAGCADPDQRAYSPALASPATSIAAEQVKSARALLPKPLAPADAERYRRIFALQDNGEWQRADREIREVRSDRLMGHVQFQRYMHPTAYRSSYQELATWLNRYGDHPDAYRVYSLARKRQPDGADPPTVPDFGEEHLRHLLGDRRPSPQQVRTANHSRTSQEIRGRIARSHLTVAERMIDGSDLPAEYADRLRAQAALGWLALGNGKKALTIAAGAAERSRNYTSVPDWVAGLAAFDEGQYEKAERHFRLYWKSSLAGEWGKAAGAYWAARASARAGRQSQTLYWLKAAAEYPYSFYGQIALARLGDSLPTVYQRMTLTAADIARLEKLKGGVRAFALIQAGQIHLADEELLQYLADASPELARSITAVAEAANLPRAAMRGAYYLARIKDTPTAKSLYPAPDWQPQDGFQVDRALIWAFVRQESAFDPRATSWAGARGLMQLMPTTANYVAGEERFEGARRDALYDPPLNLSLGQQYLRYLMNKEAIGNDLFRLAVAYNAGIGNLLSWKREGLLANDPLMFIETLPFLETRLFVERVLANYWMYRSLMGQPRPSLQAIIDGQWPRYQSQDGTQVELAEGNRHAD